jgi:hypothetical protein
MKPSKGEQRKWMMHLDHHPELVTLLACCAENFPQ